MDWFDAAVIAAIIAAFGSLGIFAADRYLESLSRKRGKAAEALSDALLWLEMPYRIARRVDDQSNTLSSLATALHHLQERHIFNRAWLQIEVPPAYEAYGQLLDEIKNQCAADIADAWKRSPATRPEQMNLGPIYEVDVGTTIVTYVEAVKVALRPWWSA